MFLRQFSTLLIKTNKDRSYFEIGTKIFYLTIRVCDSRAFFTQTQIKINGDTLQKLLRPIRLL